MQRCGCCNRHLMTGETFRLYRRPVRRSLAIVCAQCRVTALGRGWQPEPGQVYRQMTRRPRMLRLRTPRHAGVDRVAAPDAGAPVTNP